MLLEFLINPAKHQEKRKISNETINCAIYRFENIKILLNKTLVSFLLFNSNRNHLFTLFYNNNISDNLYLSRSSSCNLRIQMCNFNYILFTIVFTLRNIYRQKFI